MYTYTIPLSHNEDEKVSIHPLNTMYNVDALLQNS